METIRIRVKFLSAMVLFCIITTASGAPYLNAPTLCPFVNLIDSICNKTDKSYTFVFVIIKKLSLKFVPNIFPNIETKQKTNFNQMNKTIIYEVC